MFVILEFLLKSSEVLCIFYIILGPFFLSLLKLIFTDGTPNFTARKSCVTLLHIFSLDSGYQDWGGYNLWPTFLCKGSAVCCVWDSGPGESSGDSIQQAAAISFYI